MPSGSFTNQYLKQVPFMLVTSLNTRALNQPILQLLWSEVIQTFLCHYHILIVVIASRVANSTGKAKELHVKFLRVRNYLAAKVFRWTLAYLFPVDVFDQTVENK